MAEVGIVLTIWVVATGVVNLKGMPASLRQMSDGLRSEHLIVALLMLATHAATERAGAAEALSNPFTPETLLRALFVLIAFILVVPTFVARARLSQAVRSRWYGSVAMMLYAMVAIASITWSRAPMVTAGKALETSVALAVVWSLLARPDREDALKRTVQLVLFLEGTLIVVAVIGFFVAPGIFAETQSRTGFVFSKTLAAPYLGSNGASALGGMLTAFALAQYFARSRRNHGAPVWLWVAGAGTLSIVLGSGRQGVAIWVAAISVLLWIFRRELFLLVVAPLSVALFAIYGSTIITSLERGQVEGSLDTLTGRTTFWAAGVDAFQDRPLTGFGYGAGGRYEALARVDLGQYTHLHNGYLESLVGVGLIGFLPLLFAVSRVVVWAATRLLRKVDAPYAILLVPLLLQNAIGLGFGAWLTTHLILFALLVALSDAQGIRPPRRRLRAARNVVALQKA